MKSLNFTVLGKELEEELKTQTIRTLFIPTFEENETINICFKKTPLYQAKITEIYCKKISELNSKEAKLDGFETKKQLIKTLLDLNNLKSTNRFCFVIRFKRVSQDILKFINKKEEKN